MDVKFPRLQAQPHRRLVALKSDTTMGSESREVWLRLQPRRIHAAPSAPFR
jgi:hypothetical protein